MSVINRRKSNFEIMQRFPTLYTAPPSGLHMRAIPFKRYEVVNTGRYDSVATHCMQYFCFLSDSWCWAKTMAFLLEGTNNPRPWIVLPQAFNVSRCQSHCFCINNEGFYWFGRNSQENVTTGERIGGSWIETFAKLHKGLFLFAQKSPL